ncbi:hypothetical protein ACH5RR_018874 [Cinchona calisaya]|uniref:Uncharacterized protein n=1 Tax=Cinchona calisaya TaxID=153742 RepID=A0ABD2ZRC3_9GENT
MSGPFILATNPIEPGLHYGLQDGISRPISLESSGFHGDSIQNPTYDSTLSVEAQAVVGSTSLPKVEIDGPAINGDAKNASSSQAILQASAAISVTELQRNKKRTMVVVPSLRSNKKVSSLVDKWKAAKGELQEEEKEPENAYEILEEI